MRVSISLLLLLAMVSCGEEEMQPLVSQEGQVSVLGTKQSFQRTLEEGETWYLKGPGWAATIIFVRPLDDLILLQVNGEDVILRDGMIRSFMNHPEYGVVQILSYGLYDGPYQAFALSFMWKGNHIKLKIISLT